MTSVKLRTWNANLTRRLVDKVYTFVPAVGGPAPHQEGPPRNSPTFWKTEAVVKDHADFFALRAGSSIFCATGERGGVTVFAEGAAGSLVAKLMQWYTWQARSPSLGSQSPPEVLPDMTEREEFSLGKLTSKKLTASGCMTSSLLCFTRWFG